jgi:hypothetical protein
MLSENLTPHKEISATPTFKVQLPFKIALNNIKRSATYCVMSYSDTPHLTHMTTMILLTLHSPALDYAIDQNSNYSTK